MTVLFAVKVKVQFSTGGLVIIRDRNLVKKIPTLVAFISRKYPDWKHQDIRINDPLRVPFPIDAGAFFLENVMTYVPPSKRDGETTLRDYPGAAGKSLVELKTIESLAEWLQCYDFRDCIQFVRNKRHDQAAVMSIEEYMAARIAEFRSTTSSALQP